MIKVTLPENLNDITLGQMQRYDRAVSELPEGSDREHQLIMLQEFCGVDPDMVDKMNAQQLTSILSDLQKVLDATPSHDLFFSLEGVRMGFIPNLDEITMGEFVDLENLGSETEHWHKIMAVLYRPVESTFGDRYEIKAYDGHYLADIYKQMPLGVALGALLFFWNLGKDLLNDTLRSLNLAMEDKAVSTALQKSGDGLEQYTAFVKETLDELTRLQSNPFTLASIGSATKVTYEN